MLALKVLFRKSDGRLLGAQALGEDGPAVDKRISALAVAIQMGATIYDLEEAELCYAPQFGSAKDPVNFAGMVAADVLRRRHAARPLGWHATARSCSTCASRWSWSWRACRARSTSRWASSARACGELPARPRDPRHLPLRPARLLRDAHPAAERVQGPEPLRRHAVTRDAPASREARQPRPGAEGWLISGRIPPASARRWRRSIPARTGRKCLAEHLKEESYEAQISRSVVSHCMCARHCRLACHGACECWRLDAL